MTTEEMFVALRKIRELGVLYVTLTGGEPLMHPQIHEILETGTARALVKLQKRIPKTVIEMLKLPGMGPKRARIL